jgi:ketosteroid isomerase-like protein
MKLHFAVRVILCLAIPALFLSCRKECASTDLTAEKIRVENAIHKSIGWAKNKEIQLLYSVIANDSNYIEVDPNEKVVRGFEDFKKAETFWLHPDFKAIRYEIRDLDIQISRSGEVAWFFCVLDDINEWKGQPANWENTRWTGVLEKRDNRWVIVQMHFSFASH